METKTPKHTGGDWKHVGESGGVRYIMVGDVCLAVVHSTLDGIDNEARAAESYANGDLFAAAPDLLAACNQVATWLEVAGKYSDSLELLKSSGMPYNASILRTAIAKAEGKAEC